MGLIKAALGSVGGVLADQWREYFYCDSLEDGVIVTKGVKRTTRRGSNKKGSDNIISNGSVIAVNEGQCMMIVEQGKVVEFSSEPGEFIWDSSTEVLEKGFWIPGIPLRNVLRWAERLETTRGSISLTQRK